MSQQFGDFSYALAADAAEYGVGQFLASKGVTSNAELATWLTQASAEDRRGLEDAFFRGAISIAPAGP